MKSTYGSQRIARIKVTGHLLRENPEMVIQVFNFIKFMPMEIEESDYFDVYLYTGTSPLFPEIYPGDSLYTFHPDWNVDKWSGQVDGVRLFYGNAIEDPDNF